MQSPGGNRKSGRCQDRQTDVMAAQGRTRKGCHHMRWALVWHRDGLLSDLHLPVLGGLPSTVGSSCCVPGGQSHGTRERPPCTLHAPASENRENPTSGAAGGRGAEGRPKPLSQALHTGGEQDSRLTGNAYILTSPQEALNQ